MAGIGRLPIPNFRPDLSDQEQQWSRNITNVVPQGDGYGPFPSLTQLSATLAGPCRGFFFTRNPFTQDTVIIAGTSTNLYRLDNGSLTWTPVSRTAAYNGCLFNQNWEFVAYNQYVFATQGNDNLQVIDITGQALPVSGVTNKFDDVANCLTPATNNGPPPQAAYVEVINRFLVLSGLSAQNFGNRIQWSDLDNPFFWGAGFNQADFQSLPDGGLPKSIAGFDLYGVVFQDNIARLLTYTPGAPYIFSITKITGGDGNGILAPYAMVIDQDNVFWLSTEGFKMLSPGASPTPIGKEWVDRYFFANADVSNIQLMIATADPVASRIFFAYKSMAGQAGLFDTILCYDWKLQKWTKINLIGEYLGVVAKPGTTEEALDIRTTGSQLVTAAAAGTGGVIRLTVGSTAGFTEGTKYYVTPGAAGYASNAAFLTAINQHGPTGSSYGIWPVHLVGDGIHIELTGSSFGASTYTSGGVIGGNIETQTFPFDSLVQTALSAFAIVDSTHALSLSSTGNPALEAIMETGEQGSDEKRFYIGGLRVITDATSVFGSLSYRENPQSAYTYSAESAVNQLGICVQRLETRYARARIRIPAGTTWTYAMAVEPVDVRSTGSR